MEEKTIQAKRDELMGAFKVSSQERVDQGEAEKAAKQGLVTQKQLGREALDRSLLTQEEEKEQELVAAAASFTIDRMPVGTNLGGQPEGNPEDLVIGGKRRRLTPKR